MDINQKINLRAVTSDLKMLIKSNYSTVIVDKTSIPALLKLGINNAGYLGGNCLQIPTNFDVISLNNSLFVHKYTRGDYFTYRVSNSKTNEFSGTNNARAGEFGIHFVLKPTKGITGQWKFETEIDF